MKEYEELVKALRCEKDCKECSYWQDNAWSHCDEWGMRCDAADAIEELQAEVPRWIPVTERLPEMSQNVLVANKRGKIYDIDKAWWNGMYFDRCGKKPYFNVSHWMPLPDAPEVEGCASD